MCACRRPRGERGFCSEQLLQGLHYESPASTASPRPEEREGERASGAKVTVACASRSRLRQPHLVRLFQVPGPWRHRPSAKGARWVEGWVSVWVRAGEPRRSRRWQKGRTRGARVVSFPLQSAAPHLSLQKRLPVCKYRPAGEAAGAMEWREMMWESRATVERERETRRLLPTFCLSLLLPLCLCLSASASASALCTCLRLRLCLCLCLRRRRRGRPPLLPVTAVGAAI